MRRARLVTGILLLFGQASAGTTVTYVEAGRKVTLAVDRDRVRVEQEGSPVVLVFDGDAGRYLEIDNARRTYAVATRDDVIAAGKALDARVRKKEASADPAERAAWAEHRDHVQKRLALMKRTRFEPTGVQAMVADTMCDGFKEWVGDELVAQGCYVLWNDTTFRREEFDGITRLAEFLNSAIGQVESAQGLDLRDGPLGRLKRSPGFPLLRLDLKEGGRSGVPLQVTELRHGSLSRELFEPPAGYKALEQPPLSLPFPVLPTDGKSNPR